MHDDDLAAAFAGDINQGRVFTKSPDVIKNCRSCSKSLSGYFRFAGINGYAISEKERMALITGMVRDSSSLQLTGSA